MLAAECPECGRIETRAALAVLNAEIGQWQVHCPVCCGLITGVADKVTAAALAAGKARLVPRRGVDDVIADETLEALIWPDGDTPVWPAEAGGWS